MTHLGYRSVAAAQEAGRAEPAATDPAAVRGDTALVDFARRRVARYAGEPRSPGDPAWNSDLAGV